MAKFKNKYRIESSRLQSWDYRNGGYYYITIVTKGHRNYFGEVKDGIITLNEYGKIVESEWMNCKTLRNYVELDEWIIMPNHLHGILIIDKDKVFNEEEIKSRLLKDSLGSIIGQYKSKCTKTIRSLGETEFQWQERFYDHIIRNEQSLNKIRNYIRLNPMKWELDQYYNKI
ncbi:MAG: transposase [Ignavibacterium sp.]|jgi:REP element-mobilizing transposase RayT|uniref:transposase n=1 Tax=Ignavibacterium sp. TaxID=2651167 RepID=UPI00329A757B